MKRGGIFIIEDLYTSVCTGNIYDSEWGELVLSPDYHHPNPNNRFKNPTTIDFLKTLVDEINFPPHWEFQPSDDTWYVSFARREDWREKLSNEKLSDVESIHFMNAIAVIYKRLSSL